MSNGPPPARPDGPIDDARWLFPQEQAPPPRNEALILLFANLEAKLNACFDVFEAKLDARFGKLNARFDAFKAKLDARFGKLNARFDAFEVKLDARFGNLEAKVNTTFAKVDTELEAPHLLARTGITPSVHIPSSTTTWMSSPTAAGSTLWIEEVCTRQDAPLEADFQSFPDKLDQRQPSTHTPFASLDNNDDDDMDEAIHIVRSIDDANVDFEDIFDFVLVPPPPLPYAGAVMPFLWGECPLSSPTMLSAFESATVPPQKTARRLKRPRRRPCRRNRPRAPNPSDEATPSHPQPMMGGTSTPTTTLQATSARATTHRSMTSSPMSCAMTSSSSPSLQPFLLHENGSIKKGERDAHHQKGTCRRIHPRRVGQRHRPRAPNPLNHLLCGGRHRPRASNQSTGWASA